MCEAPAGGAALGVPSLEPLSVPPSAVHRHLEAPRYLRGVTVDAAAISKASLENKLTSLGNESCLHYPRRCDALEADTYTIMHVTHTHCIHAPELAVLLFPSISVGGYIKNSLCSSIFLSSC